MTTVREFVIQASSSYLQNVVFVDDKIYQVPSGRPVEESFLVDVPSGLKSPFATDSSSDENELAGESVVADPDTFANTPPLPSQELSVYHPRNLMESFAKKGIVCALYEPRKEFDTGPNSEIFRLCERADIVILDWDLHNDAGKNVNSLLAELIKQSASLHPHHVRLCVVYTDNPNLHRVTNLIYEELIKSTPVVDVDASLKLSAGATRIAIFGKPGSLGRTDEEKAFEVNEDDLADRVIEEFATLHGGVLQAFALHGLAAIRRNTKRFLDKFRREMDGAFLLHRALSLSSDEAFDQLPELVADEMRAVLEDSWPETLDVQALAIDAIQALRMSEPPQPWKKKQSGTDYDVKPALQEFLGQGTAGLADARQHANEGKDVPENLRNVKPARLLDFDHMLQAEGKGWSDQLAMLFCNRTQYGQGNRTLRYGTIVRHKEPTDNSWMYSVCLMPVCDALRLNADRKNAFPFWILKEDAKLGVSGSRRGLVVDCGDGSTVSLAAGGKIREMLWMAEFSVDATSKTVVSQADRDVFLFPHESKRIEWAGELKPLHVQRIASDLGQAISRVGLVESEWLRLFCDR